MENPQFHRKTTTSAVIISSDDVAPPIEQSYTARSKLAKQQLETV